MTAGNRPGGHWTEPIGVVPVDDLQGGCHVSGCRLPPRWQAELYGWTGPGELPADAPQLLSCSDHLGRACVQLLR